MAIQTFRSKAAAEEELETMQGWDAEVAQMLIQDPSDRHESVIAYVIQCGENLYLNEDGYVK
jgi:hypothetical protein